MCVHRTYDAPDGIVSCVECKSYLGRCQPTAVWRWRNQDLTTKQITQHANKVVVRPPVIPTDDTIKRAEWALSCVEKMIVQGYSVTAAVKRIGVSLNAFYNWRKTDASFRKRLDEARQKYWKTKETCQ